jgi:hypothetical protein
MTLREYLNRRLWRGRILLATALAVVCAFTFRAPLGSVENAVMRWSFMIAFVGDLWIASRARCPRCGMVIGYIDATEAGSNRKWRKDGGFSRCGNCGLHLEERILPGKGAAGSQ